jgi:mRNA interferase MazF
MSFERFDVVVVPFPFVDAPETKPRPALVLSTAVFNRVNRHAVLAMITRATHARWPSDHPIADLGPDGAAPCFGHPLENLHIGQPDHPAPDRHS